MSSFSVMSVLQLASSFVFFSAFVNLLRHLQVLQYIVFVVGWLIHQIMDTKIGESFVAVANIFLGPVSYTFEWDIL